MITVSVQRLVEAIEEANAFSLPEMNDGTEYLYANLYGRLSRGEDVSLSSLNFDAFDLEDVEAIGNLHSDILEPGEYQANGIARLLRGLSPVVATSAFV